MFFKATNTLGALTTAILVSAVAPSSSWRASRLAVSSEYCARCQPWILLLSSEMVRSTQENRRKEKEKTYPKLTFIPILPKGLHAQRVREPRRRSSCCCPSTGLCPLLGFRLQLFESLGPRITLCVELLERVEGVGRESADGTASIKRREWAAGMGTHIGSSSLSAIFSQSLLKVP